MSPAGRPKSEKPKEIRYSVRLDEETETRLKMYCQQKGITRGEAVRQAIQLLLNQK